MTWEPSDPDVDSRMDFYHYQVLDDLSEENASVVLDFNTTNTTIIININRISTSAALVQFVLSAYNCNGASALVTVVIFNGENLRRVNKYYHNFCYTYTDQSGGKTMYTISSRSSLGPMTEIQEFQNNNDNGNILLTSISSVCGAVLFVMLITCSILSLVFLKLLRKKDQEFNLPQVQGLYDEIPAHINSDI